MKDRPIDEQGRQKRMEILRFVNKFAEREQRAPTLAEIAEGVGLSGVSAVQLHVAKLKDQQLLEQPSGARRAIRVTPAGKAVLHGPA